MRPSTAISAGEPFLNSRALADFLDGPGNIQEAVTAAISPDSKDRGALIVLNDRISSAYYTQKTNANNLDTFKALEQGYIGGFLNFAPFYYYPAGQPTFKQTFDISQVETLPQVDLLIRCVFGVVVSLISDIQKLHRRRHQDD